MVSNVSSAPLTSKKIFVFLPSMDEAITFLQKNSLLEDCTTTFRDVFKQFPQVDFKMKNDGSLVSDLELEIEKVIGGYLKEKTPWAGFQGEEGTAYPPALEGSQFKWYLDPIDGTISFRNGIDTFAFTLTLVHGNEALATVIDFPRLDATYQAFKNRGAFKNNQRIRVSDNPSEKSVFALSDDYTFKMVDRQTSLHSLRELPFIVRTQTDIHAYCLVAEGKCIGKFDAAGGLWDLWPGYLLIKEAEGECHFFPIDKGSEDLAGSMLIGGKKTLDIVLQHLRKDPLKNPLPHSFSYPFKKE